MIFVVEICQIEVFTEISRQENIQQAVPVEVKPDRGVDVPKNDSDMYGLRYAEFVVPLVKAVQQQMIESLQAEVAALKDMVQEEQPTSDK